MHAALQASLGKLSLSSIGDSSTAVPASAVTDSTLIAMTTTTKALFITGSLATASLPFLLSRPEKKPAPAITPKVVKLSAAQTKPKPSAISDEETFAPMFGGDHDKSL